jgi:hypothetical protein
MQKKRRCPDAEQEAEKRKENREPNALPESGMAPSHPRAETTGRIGKQPLPPRVCDEVEAQTRANCCAVWSGGLGADGVVPGVAGSIEWGTSPLCRGRGTVPFPGTFP